MSEQFNANDQHYASKDIEPILVQEQIMETVSEVPAKVRLCIAQALRYLMRAGTKQGEDWKKELSKAENYIHRARTGEWIKANTKFSKTTLDLAEKFEATLKERPDAQVIITAKIGMSPEEIHAQCADILARNFPLKPSTQTKESAMVAKAKTKKATTKKATPAKTKKPAAKKPVAAKVPKS